MATVQTIETWKNIIRNVSEDVDSEYGNEVEVVWLDGTDEWCLCHGTELFEDGFATEREATYRLEFILDTIIESC